LGIFVQLYNLKVDDTLHQNGCVGSLPHPEGEEEVWHAVETADRLHQGGEQLTIQRVFAGGFFGAGQVCDRSDRHRLLRTRQFIRMRFYDYTCGAKAQGVR